MSAANRDTPELVVYRLEILEGKVDNLLTKFDEFKDTVNSRMCPAPGSCVQLGTIVERLDKLVTAHEGRIAGMETTQLETKNFVRGAIWVAGGVGAALAVIGPALVSGLKAVLFAKS